MLLPAPLWALPPSEGPGQNTDINSLYESVGITGEMEFKANSPPSPANLSVEVADKENSFIIELTLNQTVRPPAQRVQRQKEITFSLDKQLPAVRQEDLIAPLVMRSSS